MWTLNDDGNAVNSQTGEMISIRLCSDGLVRVYRNKKIIFVCHSVSMAKNFIAQTVQEFKEDSANENSH